MDPNLPNQNQTTTPTSTPQPVQSAAPQAFNASSGKSKKKWVLLLFLILIIVVAVFGASFYFLMLKAKPQNPQISQNNQKPTPVVSGTPKNGKVPYSSTLQPMSPAPLPTFTPISTTGWKTYVSPLGFSVLYPSTVTVEGDRFFLNGDTNRKDTQDGFGPNLLVTKSKETMPDNAVKKALGNESVVLKEVTFSGVKGVQNVYMTDGFDYFLASPSGNAVIRFLFSTQRGPATVTKESIDTMYNIANQILLTLKFK